MNIAPIATRRLAAAIVLVIAGAISANPSMAEAPVVTNVQAEQISGTGLVRVTFDVSDAEGDQVSARLMASSNGGTTFDLLAITVAGDALAPMAPGLGKEIIWNAAADYPGRYWGQVVAKVVCSDGMLVSGEMVLVPAGSFTMGKDGVPDAPAHVVTLDAFYIDKYEVTNAEYQQFIDAGGYTTAAYWSESGWSARVSGQWSAPMYWGQANQNTGPAYPGYPVHGITYYEAEAFAAFVGKRLPTEAEWEKAARGTDGRTYPWGEDIDNRRANYAASGDPFEIGNYSWSSPVGFYDGRRHPSPSFQTINSPGPYGTYDQVGNVAEWVKDWYGVSYYSTSPGVNPQGPAAAEYPHYTRTLRGGDYTSPLVTAFRRSFFTPITPRNDNNASVLYIGLRCAKSLQ